MAKDPNRLNPPPRGHISWGAFIIWCIVIAIGLIALANREQSPEPDITPVPPSQTERR